jgi:hypothetical protein
MSNFTEIDTEPTLTAAARFTANVADLRAHVDPCLDSLRVLAGCWGDGDDSRAFGAIYDPWAAEIVSATTALLGRLEDTGTHAGMAALGAEETDETGGTDLNSVGEEA